jgi:hypothetical protein
LARVEGVRVIVREVLTKSIKFTPVLLINWAAINLILFTKKKEEEEKGQVLVT